MLTLDTDANWQDRHARLVSTKVFPSAQEITDFLALLRSMLQFEPRSRPSSVNLLEHTWFKGAKLLNQG
jgi:serine/threonine protein kinase